MRAFRYLMLLIMPMILTGCFFVPGKFGSTMHVGADGSFTFSYKGEVIAGTGKSFLDSMAGMDDKPTEFEPYCYNEKTDKQRDCTAAEVKEQRAEHDKAEAERVANNKKESAEMAAIFGGLDPNNPATYDQFVARLLKQKGWNSVVHKGEGVFEVDYSIAGTLDHDFVFPNIPDVKFASPFVVARVRKDGSVQVRGEGFAIDPVAQMTNGTAAIAAQDKEEMSKIFATHLKGTFTLTTDGELLTNNTEDGASAITLPAAGKAKAKPGKQLDWTLDPNTDAAPEALIKRR